MYTLQGVSYPEQAGYPIGGDDFPRYVMLEVHFNNPEKIAGTPSTTLWQLHLRSMQCLDYIIVHLKRPFELDLTSPYENRNM